MGLSAFRRVLLLLASESGYPTPVRAVINHSPLDTTIEAPDATINRGCRLFGDIRIETGAVVERGTELRGEVTVRTGARVGRDSKIDGTVTVGRETNLVESVEAVGRVNIGAFGAIGRRVTFQEENHVTHRAGMQAEFYDKYLDEFLGVASKGPIDIGHDVWIGADATILSGVEVGSGAVVGAGSIVTDDVEPYSVVAGVPAEHKKYRFPEHIRSQLLDIEWWDWSIEKIRQNKQFFTTDLTEVEDVYELLQTDTQQ